MSLLPELRKMLAFIDQNVDGCSTKNDQRYIAAGTLFEAASCHAKGVSILLEEKLYASAAALQRILFESFICGSWLLHCANENEMDCFLNKDKIKPYFGDLVSAVEKELDWPNTLSKVKSNIWKAMNSYTHGGNMQVTRNFDGSSGILHQIQKVVYTFHFLNFECNYSDWTLEPISCLHSNVFQKVLNS